MDATKNRFLMKFLSDGFSIPALTNLPDPDTLEGDEAGRRVWESCRDTFLPAWIAKRPGTRPWAWWRWEAPERRRRIDGGMHQFDVPSYIAEAKRIKRDHPEGVDLMATTFGLPRYSGKNTDWTAEYETEFDYLQRLNLLAPGEREAIDNCADIDTHQEAA